MNEKELVLYITNKFGSGALSGKMLLVRIFENNFIMFILGQVSFAHRVRKGIRIGPARLRVLICYAYFYCKVSRGCPTMLRSKNVINNKIIYMTRTLLVYSWLFVQLDYR